MIIIPKFIPSITSSLQPVNLSLVDLPAFLLLDYFKKHLWMAASTMLMFALLTKH